MQLALVLLAVFVRTQGAERGKMAYELFGVRSGIGINPHLHPVSDSKFYDGARAEYVRDGNPHGKDHFSYPFPEVQDSNDFEHDYVKDENSDHGEYKANVFYNRLRAKLWKEKMNIKELLKDREIWEHRVHESQDNYDRAQSAADAAERTVDGSDWNAGAANGSVDHGTDKVIEEINQLDKCEEELRRAKEKLDNAIAERRAAIDAHAASVAREKAAQDAQIASKSEEVKLEIEVKEEAKEHKAAQQRWEEDWLKVRAKETELAAAEKKLRPFRAADGGPNTKGEDGGVYRQVFHSGARRSVARIAAAAAVFAAHLLA